MPDSSASTFAAPRAESAGIPWWLIGLTFVLAAVGWLELLHPYFFCQDDALCLELPGVLLACRAVWQGLSPEYNPYIFLGCPAQAIVGVYPPTYLSYAVARHVLGDENATFEVFALLHLVAGYCLTHAVARRLGIGPPLAALAAATFVLSGPVLVMARCWSSFAVPAAFIPLCALLVDRLRDREPDWRWPACLGLALGLFYHAGFPQLFVLGGGIMLVHAATLAMLRLVPAWRLRWLAPALAFGAALAIPLFLQQWRLSWEIDVSSAGGGDGVAGNLLAILLPYPLARGALPNGWGNFNLQWGGHLYYCGTILTASFLAALAAGLRHRLQGTPAVEPVGRETRMPLALAVPAIVALLLSLGEHGGLWWMMGLLPVGLRNNPFRAMPWFAFFSGLAGAIHLQSVIGLQSARGLPWTGGLPATAAMTPAEPDRVPDRSRIAGERRLLSGALALAAILLAVHVSQSVIAFYTYAFRPFPQLPPEFLQLLGPDESGHRQRVMSFAAWRSSDPSYPLALPHNLPSEYEVPAVVGYNPLIQRFGRFTRCLERIAADPRAGLSAYGVRWLVVHRTAWGGWQPESENRFERIFPLLELLKALGDNRHISLPALDDYVKIVENSDAAPLAFDAAAPTTPLPMRTTAAGLDIDLGPGGDRGDGPRSVVANFLRYPDIVATADGLPLEVGEDQWQRIVVRVPAGARSLRIRYRPPWGTGCLIAVLPAVLGVVATRLCRSRSPADGRSFCRVGKPAGVERRTGGRTVYF